MFLFHFLFLVIIINAKYDQKCLIVGTKGTQERVLVRQVNESSWFEPLKFFCIVPYLRSGPSELPNQRGLWSKSNELVLKIGTCENGSR